MPIATRYGQWGYHICVFPSTHSDKIVTGFISNSVWEEMDWKYTGSIKKQAVVPDVHLISLYCNSIGIISKQAWQYLLQIDCYKNLHMKKLDDDQSTIHRHRLWWVFFASSIQSARISDLIGHTILLSIAKSISTIVSNLGMEQR